VERCIVGRRYAALGLGTPVVVGTAQKEDGISAEIERRIAVRREDDVQFLRRFRERAMRRAHAMAQRCHAASADPRNPR
jgi:hypothetical protein